jgi:hypothetical protein
MAVDKMTEFPALAQRRGLQSGIVSVCGVMGSEIESREGVGVVASKNNVPDFSNSAL